MLTGWEEAGVRRVLVRVLVLVWAAEGVLGGEGCAEASADGLV